MIDRPSQNRRNIRLAVIGAVVAVAALSAVAFIGPVRRWRAAGGDYTYAHRPFQVFDRELSALRRTLSFSVDVADKATAGTWAIQPNGVQSVWPETQEPLDALWRGTAVDDGSWQYCLHSLEILKDLLMAHAANGNDAYLETGRRIIRSWIANNPRQDPPCKYSWSDHTTANRAVNFCAFLDYCRQIGAEDQALTVEVTRSLAAHAVYLANDAHYTFQHNHGLFQDFALMVIATHLTVNDRTAAWLDVARERMARQLEETFSADGVHLENSPGYHAAIMELLERIAHYTDGVSAEAPDRLEAIVHGARGAARDFLMPNGQVVPVGDTARRLRVPGLSEPARRGFAVWADAGYGVMRDDLYVFYAASHNARGHKHRDDLSVLVADEDGLILTDAGFLNYDTDDPRQNYTTSWDAHNVVTFDGEDPQQLSRRCGIDAAGQTDDYLYLSGRSERPGATLRRSVLYDLNRDWIVIVDRCESASGRSLQWRRLFHFEPDTVAGAAGSAIALTRPSGTSYQLALWPATAPELVKGQASPLQGWVAERYGELLPAWASVETQLGSEATFVAALSAGNEPLSVRVTDDGIDIQGPDGGLLVTERAESVEIRRTGSVEAITIPLTPVELTDPLAWRRLPSPLTLRRRVQLLAVDAGAWLGLLILIWVTPLRRNRIGTVLVALAVLANAGGIIWLLPRLG